MSNNQDYDFLFDRLISGTLEQEEAERLLAGLDSNPAILDRLRLNVMADFILREDAEILRQKQRLVEKELSWDELVRLQNQEPSIQRDMPVGSSSLFSWHFLRSTLSFLQKCFWPGLRDWKESIAPVVTIICLLTVGLVTLLMMYEKSGKYPSDDIIHTLARVNETIDAVWVDGTPKYQRGQLVDETRFQLQSGQVQLEINNGTTLILEGPCDLAINGTTQTFCRNGRVSAHVSKEGTGFEIATPFGNVIDRGTEFFVMVGDNETHVQVARGKVDFLSPIREFRSLSAKQSIKFDPQNKTQTLVWPEVPDFISTMDFETRIRERAEEIKREKIKAFDEINRSPDLWVNLDFNRRNLSEIHNSAVHTSSIQPLSYSGKRTGGPLFDTSAWIFNGREDGLTLDLADSCRSMTLEMLVRYDIATKPTRVLLASNHLLTESGGILWQITRDGSLQFHISQGKGSVPELYSTVPCLGPELRGTWVRLSVVLDANKKRITQYVNGKFVPSRLNDKTPDIWQNVIPIHPGRLTIGNYVNGTGGRDDRTLNIPVGEVVIYRNVVKK